MTTPPSTTPPFQSIAAILSGWMADEASGDTGPNGADAEPDGSEDWYVGTCDWGYCNRPTVAGRFDDHTGRMIAVCDMHIGPPTGGGSETTAADGGIDYSLWLMRWERERNEPPAVCHGAAAWLCTIGHGHVCS